MILLAIGINYNTAPVAIREKLAFSPDELHHALQDLVNLNDISEAAILSTCNRTELYCVTQSADANLLIDWLSQHKRLPKIELTPYLYTYTNNAFIRHIFRVACGLDSMILGEPQILGQMKTAYQTAFDAQTMGKLLGKLFQHTFTSAKKVRTDTAIGSSPVSVAFAAVQLAQQIFDKLSEQTALLIGAGETIELTARHLTQQGIGRIIIANRTLEKAHHLATQFNGYAISLAEIPTHLAEADIVIASTGSQLPILGKGSVESALKKRKHKPMFMVDLAVPRDIEPEVKALSDVFLYTVDDLSEVVSQGQSQRQSAVVQAEIIIDDGVRKFMSWLDARSHVPLIQQLNAKAQTWREVELARARKMIERGESIDTVLQAMSVNLTKKMMNGPLRELNHLSSVQRGKAREAVSQFFLQADAANEELTSRTTGS